MKSHFRSMTNRRVATSLRVVCILALTAGFLGGSRQSFSTATTIPVAVTVCATCKSYSDLLEAAYEYANTWYLKTPPGYVGYINGSAAASAGNCPTDYPGTTTLFIASAAAPISGIFFPCIWNTGEGFELISAMPIGPASNAQTILVDAFTLRRSAKTGSILLPDTYSVNDVAETISEWLSSAAGVPLLSSTVSIWHGITNFPQAVEGTFVVTATGQTFQLWNGDTITVTDSNGWTAQFQWSPLSTIHWQLVPNSIRNAQGQPPSGSEPTSAPKSSQLPGAAVSVTLPNGITVAVIPTDVTTTPDGTITVEPIAEPPNLSACSDFTICGI